MGGQAPRRPPGRVGPYRLDRRLGAGGMGVVYLGYDDAGTTAAVKLIRPEYVAEPEFRARLRREVDAAQRVPRFCTAPVLAADLDADPPWVATEYIDAPSLDVTLLEAGRLDGEELASFAAGVAVALRAIHEHGVVHRDLKPSNILLSPLGPRVIDFGIARVADATEQTRLTETGVVVGTPAYMAPEQLRSEPLTTAVDVFAWAALVTVAATGRGPFGAGAGAMHAILHEQPELGELAEPLRGLVAAALAKDPADRPSAAELVDRLSESTSATTSQVLAQAAEGPTVASVHSAPTELATPADPAPSAEPELPAARWRPRKTAVVATAAAVAVAVVVAVVIGSAFWWWPRDLPAGGLIPGLAGNGASGTTGSHPGPGAGSSSGDQRGAAQSPEPADGEVHPAQVGPPLTGHMAVIESVAIGELDGTPIAVSGAPWDSIHVWDLASRERLGEPLPAGVAVDYRCVAVSRVSGHPVVVSGGLNPIQVWHLADRQSLGTLAYRSNVSSLVTGEWDGSPVAVSGGWDNSIRVWDLATGEQVGDAYQPLTDPLGPTTSLVVAFGEAGGTPVVAAGGLYYREAWVWDLTTGEQVSAFSTDYVASLAVGELDGTPVLVSGGVADATIRVWDLATGEPIGQPIGEPFAGHTSGTIAVALGELDGRQVVVSGAADRTVRVWDLATGEPIGQPFTGHTGAVTTVAVGELDGTPIAVSGSADRTVRIWDLSLADGAG